MTDTGSGTCRGYASTTGSATFTIPDDWSSTNKIQVIGGGGGGGSNTTGGSGGGGGGAYASTTNQAGLSGTYTYSIGTGGLAGQNGSNTWFGSSTCAASLVCAGGGFGTTTANVGSDGGIVEVGSGFSGGPGGYGGTGGDDGGGGGGGAGGPSGTGASGNVNDDRSVGGMVNGGAVGGGASGGTTGQGPLGEAGGAGGAGPGGGGGGAVGSPGSDGTDGGGGGGATNAGPASGDNGGDGGPGTEDWTSHTVGAGGGGGAASDAGEGGNGGLYGGGGGGHGEDGDNGTTLGKGAQGIIVITYTPPPVTTYEQSAYRWFANADSLTPGSALVVQDTAADVGASSQFRLRMLLHASTTPSISTTQFELQFATSTSAAGCDVDFSGETYIDVATSTGSIRYYNNTAGSAVDGAALATTTDDPSHSTHATTSQTYEEENNFVATNTIADGADGLWDFSLYDAAGTENVTYCFRIVKSNDTVLTSYTVVPAINIVPVYEKLTLEGYSWENDDATATIDTNTGQAGSDFSSGPNQLTAANAITKGERTTLRMHVKNTGGGSLNSDLALFYDRNDGIWTKVEDKKPPDYGVGNCDSYAVGSSGSANWECTVVDDQTGLVGPFTSLAIDPSGNPWVSYYYDSSSSLIVANYVGSGGNCDTYGAGSSGSDAWQCAVVDDQTDVVGYYNSIAFDSSGKPWISHYNWSSASLIVSNYVGNGGDCDTYAAGSAGSDAWECTVVDNQTGGTIGTYTSISFDPSGKAWVSYQNTSPSALSLTVANYVGSGGDCDTYTASSTGSDAWECTLVDNQTNVVGYFTSIAFDSSGNPWVSYQDNSSSSLIVANYVGSGGDCDTYAAGSTGSDAWECTVVDDQTDNVGSYTSLAFDSSGNPWVSYLNSTSNSFIVSNYVGSGGDCDTYASGSTGSDAWECTVVDDQTDNVGSYTSLAFDSSGNPWVSYLNSTSNSFIVANYVGSGGDCDTYAAGSTGSDAWECTVVDDQTDNVGSYTSLAFD